MSALKINTTFDMNFVGGMVTENGVKVAIGRQEGGAMPYDLMLGALSSCLYATFLAAAQMKKISFDKIDIEVTGEKRKRIPATLEWVNVKFIIKNPSDRDKLLAAAKKSTEDCSIYQTIGKVAEMTINIEFV